jgi:O-antigen/teichoic acid export membrane protein
VKKARSAVYALGGSTAVSVVSTFAVSKVVAVTAGVSGVGYQSFILSISVLAAGIALLGLPSALPLWISRHGVSTRTAFRVGYGLVGLPAAILCFAAALLSVHELGGVYTWPVVATGVVSGVFASIWGPIQRAVLSVAAGGNQVATIIASASVVSSISTCAFLVILGTSVLPLAVGSGLLLGQTAAAVIRTRVMRLSPTRGRGGDGVSRRELWRMSGSFFVTISVSQFALSAVPAAVFLVTDPETAGFFRAAFSVGTLPTTLLMAYVTYAAYPQLLAGGEERGHILGNAVKQTVLSSSAMSLTLSAAAPLALALAFSRDFESASGALAVLAGGTIVRILQAINSVTLMTLYRRRALFASEWGLGTFVLGLTTLGAAISGAFAAATGYLMGTLVALVITEIQLKRSGQASALSALGSSGWPAVLAASALALCAGFSCLWFFFYG